MNNNQWAEEKNWRRDGRRYFMKKIRIIFAFAFIFLLVIPQVAYANMAAPKESDIASSITFEKNDAISVLSETLDIIVDGAEADIAATYRMKNTTDEYVSTQSMFLSPNIENSGVKVAVNGIDTSFTAETYALEYSSAIVKRDWRYVILAKNMDQSDGRKVDSIMFELNFAPKEEYDVVVSYRYRLGGYPDYDYNAKRGEIHYYLTPAAMWKDFSKLTINLYLDEGMPVLKNSNLQFEKAGKRTYRYISDKLPEDDLEIVIDQNWLQNFIGFFKSPYLGMNLLIIFMVFLPIVLIILAIILIARHLRKKERH